MIFNQFEEFGNYLWHFEVTGHAMEEVLKQVMGPNDRYRGMASATGSAGTIASGDYMKKLFPDSKIVASEALAMSHAARKRIWRPSHRRHRR